MKKSELASKIEIIIIIMLFFSILVLVLNSLLPTVVLKNTDNTFYFNIESMQYSQNSDIQNLYDDIVSINILIWFIIIYTFIAFFGVIINISNVYKKISYILLTNGCFTLIFISITCYLFINYILKVGNYENILLAYIIIEPLRYAYFILIGLIVIILVSISYNIITIPILFRAYKNAKSKKQELAMKKTLTKSVENIDVFKNKKEDVNIDFYFKEKNEYTNNLNTKEMNNLEKKDEIKKETKYEQGFVNKNNDYTIEKKSVFIENNEKEKPRQKNVQKDEIKLAESFEKILFNTIDKKKLEKIKTSTNNSITKK